MISNEKGYDDVTVVLGAEEDPAPEDEEAGYAEEDVDESIIEADFNTTLKDAADDGDGYSVNQVSTFLSSLSQYGLLTLEEEREYSRRYSQTKDPEAMEKLVCHNLKLVVSVAKRYVSGCTSLELMDLITEGVDGLMKAVKKFDPERGVKFSTYSMWWIRQAITRAIQTKDKTIRVAVHMLEKMRKASALIREKEIELDRLLTYEEKLDIAISVTKNSDNADMAKEIIRLLNEPNVVSMDGIVSGAEEEGKNKSHLGDFIKDDKSEVDRDINREEMIVELHSALEILSEKELDVIARRFGLFGKEEATLESIGKSYNVTRERVRQIEQRALKKLREYNPSLIAYLGR